MPSYQLNVRDVANSYFATEYSEKNLSITIHIIRYDYLTLRTTTVREFPGGLLQLSYLDYFTMFPGSICQSAEQDKTPSLL